MPPSRITAVQPPSAIDGARITLDGTFSVNSQPLPYVTVGGVRARVVYASATRLGFIVPAGLDGGRTLIEVDGATALVTVAAPVATGLHQVDNPVFDRDGNLYVTYSGTRGQQVPVSIFRVTPGGTRETFSSGIINPTSMAVAPDGRLYVSSRFEGIVYRVAPDGSVEPFTNDLGVACGLAFAPAEEGGTLFVGDRSGTIFKVDQQGRAAAFALLPASVAAFHLAYGPPGGDAALFVTGPTLAPSDPVFRIDAGGKVTRHYEGFGRPQGLAFDAAGTLHVVEALAGSSGLYRLRSGGPPELVVGGPGLVGVAFGRERTTIVTSNDTAYRLLQ